MAVTNRHRETDNRQITHFTVSDYDPGHAEPSSVGYNTDPRKATGELKAIDDVYDPQYFQKKQRGEVVLHPMSLTKDVRATVQSNWVFGPHPNWGTRVIQGDMATYMSTPPSGSEWQTFRDSFANAKDLALIQAYAKMKSPDVLFGVTFHEREKTLRMVRKPLNGSLRLAEQIFARKISLMRRGWTATRAAAQAWLELRFGWRPFMYEISGIAKAVSHARAIKGTRLVARSGVELKYEKSYASTLQGVGGTYVDMQGTWVNTTRASAGVIYHLRDASEAEWRRHCLGLDLGSVPATVWDALLLSFVIDYYYKVGTWLQAITPNPLFEVEGNWCTLKEQQRHAHKVVEARLQVNTNPATLYHANGGSYVEQFDYVSRDVGVALPTVPPKVAIPLSFSKIVDQIALIVGGVNSHLHRL